MANGHRIPREKFPVSQNTKEELQKKIDEGLAEQKKRTENILNPGAVISAPIKITKEKSKKRRILLAIFKK